MSESRKRILLGGHAPEVLAHWQGFSISVVSTGFAPEAGNTLLNDGFVYSLTGKPESLSIPSPSRPRPDITRHRPTGKTVISQGFRLSDGSPQRENPLNRWWHWLAPIPPPVSRIIQGGCQTLNRNPKGAPDLTLDSFGNGERVLNLFNDREAFNKRSALETRRG